jgi:hypothetical protein
MNTIQPQPQLIDSSARAFFQSTLAKCHENRIVVYSWIFNIVILVGFILVFGISLYICRKRKITPEEQYYKMLRDQEFILAKIRYYQNDIFKPQQKEKSQLITDIPLTENALH